jgi:hypothetical protein
MTADQEDDSILLSYAEAEGSGRVVCCGAGVSCWHKRTSQDVGPFVRFRGEADMHGHVVLPASVVNDPKQT